MGAAGRGGDMRTWAGRAAARQAATAGSLTAVGAEPCTAVWGRGGLGGRVWRFTEQAGRVPRA